MATIQIHEKYKPLYQSKSRYYYVQGGRGSGKSVAVADFIARLCLQKGHRILWLRYTMASAELSVIPEFKSTLELNGLLHLFDITKTGAICKATKSEIIFKGVKTSSGNQTAALKSIPNITTMVYEEFEEHPDQHSFNEIDLSIRVKDVQNRILLISNALNQESWQYKHWYAAERDDTTYIYTTYLDNLRNLNADYIAKARKSEIDEREYYNRYYLGEHYSDTQGALWLRKWLKHEQRPEHYDRVLVGVDPAVTSNAKSDETGIIVAGKKNDYYYVLDDASGRHSPAEWASMAVSLYYQYGADAIVGEKNNGGDMVQEMIHNADKAANFIEVWASKGKHARAEPIAGMYQRGLVYHCEKFSNLENQMVTWTGESKQRSPDRIDALVWTLTKLSEPRTRIRIN